MRSEDHLRLVRVGPGTPAGELFRRYWQPAALSAELPERDGAPVRVRLLGEDLIAFRDTQGRVGLVDAYCPHRRAPLFFGRNEECGLRCVYHGWKFDADGNCVDLPSEPADSPMKHGIRIKAYPTVERGGIVWAYLGPPGADAARARLRMDARARDASPRLEDPIRRAIICRGSKAGSTPRMSASCTTTRSATAAISIRATARRRSTCTRPITAITTSRRARSRPSAIGCASINTSCRSSRCGRAWSITASRPIAPCRAPTAISGCRSMTSRPTSTTGATATIRTARSIPIMPSSSR